MIVLSPKRCLSAGLAFVTVICCQPNFAAERWAVIETGRETDSGLYMVSGDVRPEGANAWYEPASDSLISFDHSRTTNYLATRYSIPYRPIPTNHTFRTPPVGWMTWYAVKFGASDKVVMRNARDFIAKFRGYTEEKPVLWVDWEWFHSRMEENGIDQDTDMLTPRRDVYPRGMKPVADDLRAMGFVPALWVSVFSDVRTNAAWRAHSEWVLGESKSWCGAICGNPCAPGFCESFVPEVFALYKGWGYEAFKWDTLPVAYERFEKFREKGFRVDSPRATLRKCAAAVRKAVGDTCYVISCSGENDEANLAAVDYFNGGRIGGDIFSWEDFRKWGVDRILSYQPFHNTVFWADADNLVLRSEYSTEAQARTRITIYSLAGVPVTLGDEIAVLDEKRINMVRRAMPVVPMRPASLDRGVPASDLLSLKADFKRSFGSWQLRGWSNLTTNRTLNTTLVVRNSAVWDYWNDKLISADKDEKTLSISIPPCDTCLYRVTPLENDVPTLLSVSRHITQGGYELKSYSADTTGAKGTVRCPGCETVKVTFVLPEGASVGSASHPFDLKGRILRLKIGTEVRSDVPFDLVLNKRIP